MEVDLTSRRVVLMTGKGGVGRTTLSAALAKAAAREGRRVLVAEVGEPSEQDQSSLAELFGLPQFETTPRHLAERIDGVMLDSERGTELFLASVLKLKALARLAVRTKPLLRLLHAAPSFHEMGIFYHLLSLLEARDGGGAHRHDLVIFDMPATGHSLALTRLPKILLRLVPVGPMADALRAGQAILNDPAKGVACVVTLPEALPVTEALELLEGLRDSDVAVGAVVANCVPENPFSDEERAALTDLLGDGPLLGSSELERIDRADASLERLRENVKAPLLALDERPEQGLDLVEALSRQLAEVAP